MQIYNFKKTPNEASLLYFHLYIALNYACVQ